MSSTTSTSTCPSAATELAPLRAKSGWIIALGVVYVIAGLLHLAALYLQQSRLFSLSAS
jgi:uncharacterized membrane protein HdeD (DUF308 family)